MTLHVIVGAGPVGSLTASLLARSGEDVRLVSRHVDTADEPHIERVKADASDTDVLRGLAARAAVIYNAASPWSPRPIIGYTPELERQARDNEGREEDRQKTLAGCSKGDGLALGGVEALRSAGLSAIANLQGVMSRVDWYLDGGVHLERSGTLTVDHDVVRATTDLDSDGFVRQLQRCGHC